MVGPEHDPATETVAQVNHGGAAGEADHVGERGSQGQDEDLAEHHVMDVACGWIRGAVSVQRTASKQQDGEVVRGFESQTKGLIKSPHSPMVYLLINDV